MSIDKAIALLSRQPEMRWTNNGLQNINSVAQFDAAMRPFLAGLSRHDVTILSSHTAIINAGLALSVRHVLLVEEDTSGVVAPEKQIVETIVWNKQNGAWKVLKGIGATLSGR